MKTLLILLLSFSAAAYGKGKIDYSSITPNPPKQGQTSQGGFAGSGASKNPAAGGAGAGGSYSYSGGSPTTSSAGAGNSASAAPFGEGTLAVHRAPSSNNNNAPSFDEGFFKNITGAPDYPATPPPSRHNYEVSADEGAAGGVIRLPSRGR